MKAIRAFLESKGKQLHSLLTSEDVSVHRCNNEGQKHNFENTCTLCITKIENLRPQGFTTEVQEYFRTKLKNALINNYISCKIQKENGATEVNVNAIVLKIECKILQESKTVLEYKNIATQKIFYIDKCTKAKKAYSAMITENKAPTKKELSPKFNVLSIEESKQIDSLTEASGITSSSVNSNEATDIKKYAEENERTNALLNEDEVLKLPSVRESETVLFQKDTDFEKYVKENEKTNALLSKDAGLKLPSVKECKTVTFQKATDIEKYDKENERSNILFNENEELKLPSVKESKTGTLSKATDIEKHVKENEKNNALLNEDELLKLSSVKESNTSLIDELNIKQSNCLTKPDSVPFESNEITDIEIHSKEHTTYDALLPKDKSSLEICSLSKLNTSQKSTIDQTEYTVETDNIISSQLTNNTITSTEMYPEETETYNDLQVEVICLKRPSLYKLNTPLKNQNYDAKENVYSVETNSTIGSSLKVTDIQRCTKESNICADVVILVDIKPSKIPSPTKINKSLSKKSETKQSNRKEGFRATTSSSLKSNEVLVEKSPVSTTTLANVNVENTSMRKDEISECTIETSSITSNPWKFNNSTQDTDIQRRNKKSSISEIVIVKHIKSSKMPLPTKINKSLSKKSEIKQCDCEKETRAAISNSLKSNKVLQETSPALTTMLANIKALIYKKEVSECQIEISSVTSKPENVKNVAENKTSDNASKILVTNKKANIEIIDIIDSQDDNDILNKRKNEQIRPKESDTRNNDINFSIQKRSQLNLMESESTNAIFIEKKCEKSSIEIVADTPASTGFERREKSSNEIVAYKSASTEFESESEKSSDEIVVDKLASPELKSRVFNILKPIMKKFYLSPLIPDEICYKNVYWGIYADIIKKQLKDRDSILEYAVAVIESRRYCNKKFKKN